MESMGALYAIGAVFLFLLAILWFLLPFAVFGTQPKIDKLIAEVKRTNELLTQLTTDLGKADPK